MREACIKAISYYLPEKVLTNEELSELFPEWSVDKISGKVGIGRRHIASDDETAGDMAFAAANALFSENPDISKSDVDFVLLCTQSPDYVLPSTACILQHKLGLPTSCGALDFDLGCSGYEYGLAMAASFVQSGLASNVLLLTSETYSKYLDESDKGNRTIFGDGATATLVSTSGFGKIGRFVLGTDGSGAEKLIKKPGSGLFMDGQAIFDFSSEIVPEMVETTISRNNLTKDDIKLFVFHQANKYMINYLRKLLEIEKERFFIHLEDVGNTVSSTIPIALCEAQKQGLLHGPVLLAGFGVGLSWGACVIDFQK